MHQEKKSERNQSELQVKVRKTRAWCHKIRCKIKCGETKPRGHDKALQSTASEDQ